MEEPTILRTILCFVLIVFLIIGLSVFALNYGIFSAKCTDAPEVKEESGTWCYLVQNRKIIKELKPYEFNIYNAEVCFEIKKENGEMQKIIWRGDYFRSEGRQEFLKEIEQKETD